MGLKPGIIPLRPLTLGEIFDGAFGAIRHNPRVMFGLSAIVAATATLVAFLISLPLNGPLNRFLNGSGDDIPFSFTQTSSLSLSLLLITSLATPVATGLLSASIGKSVIGRKPSVKEVWAEARPRLWPLLAYAALFTFIVIAAIAVLIAAFVALIEVTVGGALALGFVMAVLLAVVGMWITVRLLFTPPAMVLEGGKLWPTVKRSWRLTRGAFWRVLGIYLLATIALGILTQVLSVPLTFVTILIGLSADGWLITVIFMVTQVITTIVSTVFMSGIVSLLYIDVRMRREGLDVELTAAAGQQDR